MPICIECRYPVSQLYHVLHSSNKTKKPPSTAASSQGSTPAIPSATAKPLGDGLARSTSGGVGDVRLTQCPRCKRFADKYVEHDFVVLFIDLVLVKPQVCRSRCDTYISSPELTDLRQVYRHLLFNRLARDDDELDVHPLPEPPQNPTYTSPSPPSSVSAPSSSSSTST